MKYKLLIIISFLITLFSCETFSSKSLSQYYGKWVGVNGNVIIEIHSNGSGIMYENDIFPYTGDFKWEENKGKGSWGIIITSFEISEPPGYPELKTSQDIKRNAGGLWNNLEDDMLFTFTPDITYWHIADKQK